MFNENMKVIIKILSYVIKMICLQIINICLLVFQPVRADAVADAIFLERFSNSTLVRPT